MNQRSIGLALLLSGFIAAFFGFVGLSLATVFWIGGTWLFARSFLG